MSTVLRKRLGLVFLCHGTAGATYVYNTPGHQVLEAAVTGAVLFLGVMMFEGDHDE